MLLSLEIAAVLLLLVALGAFASVVPFTVADRYRAPVVPALDPGTYEATVSLEGFKTIERPDINESAQDFTVTPLADALGGKIGEALKWLRVTVKEGFPCYPLFARDPFLDPIRQDPAFVLFLEEMKTRWKGYQVEFG